MKATEINPNNLNRSKITHHMWLIILHSKTKQRITQNNLTFDLKNKRSIDNNMEISSFIRCPQLFLWQFLI